MSKVGLAILMGLLILLAPITIAFGHTVNSKNTGNTVIKDLGKEKPGDDTKNKKVDIDTDDTNKKVDIDTDDNFHINEKGNRAVSVDKPLDKKKFVTVDTTTSDLNNENVDTTPNIATKVDTSTTDPINNIDTSSNIATTVDIHSTTLQTEITNMENQIVDLKIRLTTLENRLKTNSIIAANTVLGTNPLHLTGLKSRLSLENY